MFTKMSLLIFILLFGFSQAISNGQKAENGQFPYSVAILSQFGTIDSGAVLISDRYVLSWALTFASRFNSSVISLVLGSISLFHKEPWQIYMNATFDDIILPEDPYSNDIGLLRLPSPIEFSDYIQPIQLPSWAQVNETFEDIPITIIGYGANKFDIIDILRYGNTTTISNSECSAIAHYPIQPNQMCASSANKVQICPGDYGGPMLIEDKNGNMTIIGIASTTFSLQCGTDIPVIYTRLTDYLQFIANNTNVVIRDS